MRLTKDQIAEIKSFINKKGIKYIDVQMEILDHVASSVEDKMADHLTFDQALRETHTSFGVFGFSSVEDGISSALRKKYSGVFWSQFISFFGIKYIALVLLAGALFYKIQILIGDYHHSMMIIVPIFLCVVGFAVLFRINFKKYKEFLVYRISVSYLGFLGSFLLFLNVIINSGSNATFLGLNLTCLLASIILVLFTAYIITAYKTILKGIEESESLIQKYKTLP
ncbi:MAG: hypothetical protein EOO44_17625 [Flavobacterium sp.]|nr:MAG: hypothetical protein EOO44_17625 [Flavobacterium sp.]